MADRTVTVKLVADAQAYIRGVDEAARKTRESSDQIEQRLAQQREAYQQVGVAALAVGTVAAAGVLAAVNAYADFDAAMSNVQAATGESAAGMEQLSQAALDAGARTVYSATEAAAAIEELSKAGVSTADILNGGLDGALDLAAAGQIDVAEAAETAASAMTQFGLEGTDVTHIADLLAAAAGNAQGGVSDMGQALGQAGLVASQMGLSIEETTGTLAAFASAGLIGSDSGTSFRAMLLRLANPTGEVAELMGELGLSFYDAQGEFIGMEGVAGQLTERLSGLTQEQRNAALATIFGQDAIRAASILYNEGAEGVAEWTDTVNDSGYAAEQAAARLDNLQGDLEALGGAFETLLINLGSSADGPLRFLVQSLDDVVSGLADMPEPFQNVIFFAGVLTAAVLLAGGAALTVIPQFAALRTSLDTLGFSGDRASRAMTGLKAALGIGAAAFAALGAAQLLNDYLAGEFLTTSAEVQNALATSTDSVAIFREAMGTRFINTSLEEARNQLEGLPGALEDAIANWRNFADGIDPYNTEILANVNALGQSIATLAETDLGQAQAQFSEFADATDGSREQMWALLSRMPEYREHLIGIAEQQGINVTTGSEWENQEALLALALGQTGSAAEGAAGSSEVLTEEMVEQEQAAADAQASIDELADAIRGLNSTYYAAQNANADYNQSILDITASINDGLLQATLDASGNIDTTTESGINAQSMLSGLAGSALESAAAMIELEGTTDNANARVADARERFIEAAVAAGINRDAAGELANAYGLTEDAVNELSAQILAVPDGNATINVNTAAAQWTVDEFWRRNSNRVIRMSVEAGQSGVGGGAVGSDMYRAATGGRIPGYAPGYDDRFGFLRDGTVVGLGGGEYVMPTLMTDRYLPILEKMRTGEYSGYADGGRIGPTAATYSPTIQMPPIVLPAAARVAPNVQVDVHGAETSPQLIGAIAGQEVAWALRSAG